MFDFFQYCSPTRMVGGHAGILSELGPELELYRGRKACIVMDKVVRTLGILEQFRISLNAANIEISDVFDEVPQDSDVEVVEMAAHRFRNASCELLVAIGGGSVIDTAKAVNILLAHGGELRDYQGAQTLTEPLLPLIVVPTTVGTGSEATMVAVVVDRKEHRKLTFVDRAICPTLAVLDPLVADSLSGRLVVSTALDAFTHAIESYIDVEHSPFSDALAVGAGRLIHNHLLTALTDGDYGDARANLQIASTMAGIAFNHSMVGVIHAMAHSLGGVAGVPHGVANGLMLVEGLTCNVVAAADRIAEFGLYTGFVASGDIGVETAIQTIEAIRRFRDSAFARVNLPIALQAFGVQASHLPLLIERAMEDGTMIYNPKVVEPDEVGQMFKRMMGA